MMKSFSRRPSHDASVQANDVGSTTIEGPWTPSGDTGMPGRGVLSIHQGHTGIGLRGELQPGPLHDILGRRHAWSLVLDRARSPRPPQSAPVAPTHETSLRLDRWGSPRYPGSMAVAPQICPFVLNGPKILPRS